MSAIDFGSPEGRQLLRNLYAFARGLYSRVYNAEVNNRGKSFKEYVHDAVEKHLRASDGYDPSRSPLEYHLKYNVIRHAIYNDLPVRIKKDYVAQKQLTPEQAEMVHQTPEPEILVNPDDIELPISRLSEYDKDLLFSEIEKCIAGDNVVEQIYLAVAHEKFNLSDRKEICDECNISIAEFDNGRRRFLTVLRQVFKKLQLTS